MSTETKPTIPAHAGAPATRTRAHRARMVAAALAVGATAAAVNLLVRPLPAEDFQTYGALAPVRDAVWAFALVGALGAAVAYLCAGIAACLLAPARGAALASVGAVFTGLGGIAFGAGFFALGSADWLVTTDALSAEASTALFAYYQDNSVRIFGLQAAGFLAAVVGLILLSVALWRARSVPRWLPIAIPTTIIVLILSGTGIVYDVLHAVFMATLVAIAWYLWRSVSPGRGIPSSA